MKTYIREQQRIRRKIEDAAIREIFCASQESPTLGTLERRFKAAGRMEDLLMELWLSVGLQLEAAKRAKARGRK